MGVTANRGKTYAQRRAEADAKAVKLVNALQRSGKKVTSVNSESLNEFSDRLQKTYGQEEKKGTINLQSEQQQRLNKFRELTATKKQQQIQENLKKARLEKQKKQQSFLGSRNPQSFISDTPKRQDYFTPLTPTIQKSEKKYAPVTDKTIQAITDTNDKVIGYRDTSTKQSVFTGISPLTGQSRVSKEDIRQANLQYGTARQLNYDNRFTASQQINKNLQSQVLQKSFNIDEYGGLLGEINLGLQKGLKGFSKEYVKIYKGAAKGKGVYTSKVFIPPDKSTPRIAKKGITIPSFNIPIGKKGFQIPSTTLGGINTKTIHTGLDIGSYFIPVVGTSRLGIDVGSAGISLTKKETYKAIKEDPINAYFQYGGRAFEALVLGKIGYDKFLNPKNVAIKNTLKELNQIYSGKTKVKFDYSPLYSKQKMSDYNFLTKIKENVLITKPSKTIGIGKSDNLIFRDVINLKDNSLNRIILSKKYPSIKLKVSSLADDSLILTDVFWKGEKIKSFESLSPLINQKLTKELPSFSSKNFLSDYKLDRTSFVSQKSKLSTDNFLSNILTETKVKQSTKVFKPRRTLSYDLVPQNGKVKNLLTGKVSQKPNLLIGDPLPKYDELIFQAYQKDFSKSDYAIGFIDKNVRVERLKTSINVKSDFSIKTENILKENPFFSTKYLYSTIVPVPNFEFKPSLSQTPTKFKLTTSVPVANANIDTSFVKGLSKSSAFNINLFNLKNVQGVSKINTFLSGFSGSLKTNNVNLFPQTSKLVNANTKLQTNYLNLLSDKSKTKDLFKDQSKIRSNIISRNEIMNLIENRSKSKYADEALTVDATKSLVDVSSLVNVDSSTLTTTTAKSKTSSSTGFYGSNFNFNFKTPFSPMPIIPSFGLKINGGLNLFDSGDSGKGWDAFVKRERVKKGKGKYASKGYVKVNKTPLTRAGAMVRSMEILDTYTNRSGFIKKSKSKKKPSKYNDETLSFLQTKFRSKKNNPNVFVEKSGFAIDSYNEKMGIPFKGQRIKKEKRDNDILMKKLRMSFF